MLQNWNIYLIFTLSVLFCFVFFSFFFFNFTWQVIIVLSDRDTFGQRQGGCSNRSFSLSRKEKQYGKLISG